MSYVRVIPRDLFNEGNLLKCYGALWIALDNRRDHFAELGNDDLEPLPGAAFDIEQSQDDGSLTISNVGFTIRGVRYRLYRPLNSREPWPLWCEHPDTFDTIEVFTDDGELSPDFVAWIEGRTQ